MPLPVLISRKTHAERRTAARRRIVQTANRYKLARYRAAYVHRPVPRLLSMRQVNEAVCICRRQQLVPAATLAMAGFNVTEIR